MEAVIRLLHFNVIKSWRIFCCEMALMSKLSTGHASSKPILAPYFNHGI
jgi:hypothetical protein